MNPETEQQLKYPIGKFSPKSSYSADDFEQDLLALLALPVHLEKSIEGLDQSQLDTPYRPGGWTVRQVVHHLADSHMNAYIRTKWTLTEDKPVIKAYNEKDWANTLENDINPQLSIALIRALHTKWVMLIRKIPFGELSQSFIHPDTNREISLERMVQIYAWHSRHHVAHITALRGRSGW